MSPADYQKAVEDIRELLDKSVGKYRTKSELIGTIKDIAEAAGLAVKECPLCGVLRYSGAECSECQDGD